MPSTTVKLESDGSTGYDGKRELKFCTHVGHIQIYQSATSSMIGVSPGGPHKGVCMAVSHGEGGWKDLMGHPPVCKISSLANHPNPFIQGPHV